MKLEPILMTCMARNSDEIGAQVPASIVDHKKCFFLDKRKPLFMIKNLVTF